MTTRLKVGIIARDTSGLGLAYRTRDTAHLLNVQAERMGAISEQPQGFADWLSGEAGALAASRIGIRLPGPLDFAPRALYGSYLRSLLDRTLADAQLHDIAITWVPCDAGGLARTATGWVIAAGEQVVEASACVLATGNQPRRAFASLAHPDLHLGPWTPPAPLPSGSAGPVVLIGSGLTAVDSILTLRGGGFEGEILALSRNGRFPAAHRIGVSPLDLRRADVTSIRTLADVLRYFRDNERIGHDWRAVIDGLRPHTQRLWQRLSAGDQQEAIRDWSPIWNVRRHRIAAEVNERLDRDRGSGRLSVVRIAHITPAVSGHGLTLELETNTGCTTVRPAAIVDCVGLHLDCARSPNPLLRGLLRRQICVAHHTGLGLAADRRLQVADRLYALGSVLTGQLWESIAVPELRDQAALIAERVARQAADALIRRRPGLGRPAAASHVETRQRPARRSRSR